MTDGSMHATEAPMQGTIVSIAVAVGDAVRAAMPVVVIEAMKMEHVITADVAGIVRSIDAEVGANDYPVRAGTQGQRNHAKKDRLFDLVERLRLPVVLFAEGGGGRPGETDASGVSGLECMAFALFARLSGLVPLIGVVSGRCFAGNAALLGCCDVIIATEDSNIGMGGPAMIEGGGLGVYAPEDVGPISVQAPNGVVDVTVAGDVEAVRVAKQYLSYFQGDV